MINILSDMHRQKGTIDGQEVCMYCLDVVLWILCFAFLLIAALPGLLGIFLFVAAQELQEGIEAYENPQLPIMPGTGHPEHAAPVGH